MIPDVAINKNGLIVANPDGSIASVVAGGRIRQLIYIALMEMPTQTVIGEQYKSAADIEEIIKHYLDSSVGHYFPFPTSQLVVVVTRSEDEDLSVSVEFPESSAAGGESNKVDLKYEGREGYQAQLDYVFVPATDVINSDIRKVMEIIDVNTQVVRIPLEYEYSGIGAVRVYNVDDTPEVVVENVDIYTKAGVRKYNILDYISRDEVLVDTVLLKSSSDIIRPMSSIPGGDPETIPFEDGVPFVYTHDDVEDGSLIQLSVTYGNALAVSTNVDIVDDVADDFVFPMQLNRSKYIALLESPIDAGTYKAIYYANIYYPGEYE